MAFLCVENKGDFTFCLQWVLTGLYLLSAWIEHFTCIRVVLPGQSSTSTKQIVPRLNAHYKCDVRSGCGELLPSNHPPNFSIPIS